MKDDAIIVGGAFAGLAAATYLARARRSVHVIDAGQPRSRFAATSHGFLTQDGTDPGEILATAREQLSAYATVQSTEAEAKEARATEDGFAVLLANGEEIRARKLILAFGLQDVLPDIPGLQERWGQSVLHCPYCHGIEFSDREIGVLYHNPMSAQRAYLIADWGPTTLYLDGAELDAATVARLAARGVKMEAAGVRALVGEGSKLSAIALDDGRSSPVEALYLSPPTRLASSLAEQLHVEIEDTGFGPVIKTDADRMTSVRGVYAAGDIVRWPHNVTWAAADGVTAAIAAHRALVFD